MRQATKIDLSFKIWIKFKREFATNPAGTATLTNDYKFPQYRQKMFDKSKKSAIKYRDSNRCLQVRIIEHPGNKIVWQWRKPFEQHKLFTSEAEKEIIARHNAPD